MIQLGYLDEKELKYGSEKVNQVENALEDMFTDEQIRTNDELNFETKYLIQRTSIMRMS